MSIQEHIAHLVRRALEDAQQKGLLPPAVIEDTSVERPQDPAHGDFASSLPLRLARPMRTAPMAIAEALVQLIPADDAVETVTAARPGFVNFSLRPGWLADQVDVIRRAGHTYGNVDLGTGRRVQVDFVSINPTGPLHVGHARAAVIGSALANILTAAGYEVVREYYVNDAGNQMDRFYESLHTRYKQLSGLCVEMPADGYQGEYMIDVAKEIKSDKGDRYLAMRDEEAISEMGEIGLRKMLDLIRTDLETLGVEFDVWFSERSLYQKGQYETVKGVLADGGYLTERDGATWFTSPELGENGDTVVVRSTGAPTYFASDMAYHYNKFFERKFDLVIDIWGADHQGHVPRMKAVAAALGIAPERFRLLIHQLVTLKRGDELVRVSKRTGDLITLRELLEEVGADPCRFFFLARSPGSQMEFDMELAKRESSENPVYYVQYAHARISSILRLARDRGIDFGDGDLSLLTHEAEMALIRKMLLLPELVEAMARSLEPQHLPHYATELATAFHWFYQQCRVVSSIPEDIGITRARLKLVEATRIVLARCLGLMIMTAPEEM